jgi:hypothetical protein
MKFTTDLKNPMWIHFKGILFAAIEIIALTAPSRLK